MNTTMSAKSPLGHLGGSAFGGKKYWVLALIVLGGLLLRIYHNVDISLWHDEAFSALMIRYPWGEMFTRLGLDVHPPMYYVALRLWHYIFGGTLWSLRGFSIFFGTGTILAAYAFMKEAFQSQKLALWAALLVALNPFELQYVTEARMYTFGAFFAVLAAYFLVKALREQKQYHEDQKLNMPNLPQDIQLKKNFLWHYFGFAVCIAIIILTHYYLLFTAAALMLYGLFFCIHEFRKQYKNYIWFLGACCLSLIAFLPWLKTFLWQLRSVGQSYWIPDMTWWSIPSTLWTILLGFANDTANPNTQKLLIAVTLFSIFFLYQFIRRTDRFEKWLILLAVVLPFVGSVLFYVKSVHCIHAGTGLECHGRSVYMDRYFLYAAIFYSMAFAAWLYQIKTKGLGMLLVAVYCVINLAAIYNYWSGLDITTKPGMNGAAAYLGANVEPGQHVFLGTSFEFFNYKYYQKTYYPTPTPPFLYTGGRSDISQMSSVEGVALLTNADLAASFTQDVHPGNTEWVIWTYAFGSHKPEISKNWTQIDEKEFPDVRPYVGTSIYVTEYKVN
jgi:4-amino-4-deoxy-L-arabinose transferase-like glycosyltransferase